MEVSLEKAIEMRDSWIEAEKHIATTGQSYTISTEDGSRRTIQRADLSEVRKSIEYWGAIVERLKDNEGGIKAVPFLP